ncbi:hypothetical protein LIER_26487 [Lithospermum erythrorhizon]|uniref:Reverse transcriptase/retrotransposon-derived protein RNase H-like domain-containing protein n=1 Tax=Lithospermum erythrorhizon TaxID=34254 RepID=A0AAV3RBX5_LITER
MEPPKSYKEVQKLTGCLAALNRFISKSGERNLPFFKNLRRMSQERFTWDEESNKAFAELKEYLSSPQLLSRPESGETLQLYLAISNVAVSSVLIREGEGTERPIYYVSRVLRGAEERAPLQAPMHQMEEGTDPQGFEWSLHVDRARNDKGAGAGPAYEEVSVRSITSVGFEDWRTPIIQYLKSKLLPADKCDAFQCLGNAPQQPVCTLTSVVSPILFAMWGIDLVGKLPKAKRGVEFAIVATDYFNKWVKMVPLKKTRGPGTYELEDLDDKPIMRTWHAFHLSKYYM